MSKKKERKKSIFRFISLIAVTVYVENTKWFIEKVRKFTLKKKKKENSLLLRMNDLLVGKRNSKVKEGILSRLAVSDASRGMDLTKETMSSVCDRQVQHQQSEENNSQHELQNNYLHGSAASKLPYDLLQSLSSQRVSKIFANDYF